MISKEVIFDRLRKMNPSEVASIVRDALINANIEDDPETNGIYFESLSTFNCRFEDIVFAFSTEGHLEKMVTKKYLGSDTESNVDYLFEFDASFRDVIPENDSIAPVAA